jgi:hypothetical protein
MMNVIQNLCKVSLIIYGLLTDILRTSGCMVANNRVINQHYIGKVMERSGQGLISVTSRNYPGVTEENNKKPRPLIFIFRPRFEQAGPE